MVKFKLLRGKNNMYNNIRIEESKKLNSENDIYNLESNKAYSSKKIAQEKINYVVYHDLITGLYNTKYFNQRLNEKLKYCAQKQKKEAVLFIDVDNFNFINDIFGHEYGNKILKNIGEILSGCLEKEDIICRYSGDEFLILKSNIENEDDIKNFAKYILKKFQEPFEITVHKVNITLSMGIVMIPSNGKTLDEILKFAGISLREAKKLGKNRFQIFNKDIYDEFIKKYTMRLNLKKAMENEEFIVYYQPQINSKTGQMFGVEALVRWNHPQYGTIMPGEFINILEEEGYIVELGEWILRTACRQVKKWNDKDYKRLSVSVNVSESQLQDINFVNTVKKVLEEIKLEPKYLRIELTESIMIKSIEKSIYIFTELRKMGIKIALDDFGTGYSSLNYLRQLPIDIIKIDKCFIDNIVSNYYEKTITDVIMKIASNMNMDVVAEGVEKKEQLEILKQKECYNIQGYLFGKPTKPDEIEDILKAKKNFL